MALSYQTKAQLAGSTLRAMIRRGELAPGERIDMDSLGVDLRMSATPLREALRLLEAEGLIVSEPHLGMRVADFSADDAAALYDLRALLEPYATRLAVPRLSEGDIAQLERLEELHRAAVGRHDEQGADQKNEEWHFGIYRVGAERDPYLMDFISRLWNAFPWTTAWAVPGREVRSATDHAAIMVALKEGDGPRAAELMYAHVLSGKDIVVSRLLHQETEQTPQRTASNR